MMQNGHIKLSYIYSSSASVAWQSLLTQLISINGHLHSPLIRLVDVRLSSSFLSSPQPQFYSTYSAMSMAHAHVLRESWKKFEITKVWNNCLACHQGCERWEHSCVTKMEHDQTIWFCRDELSLAMLFWEDMILLLVCLKYYYFLCQYELLFWII